MFGFWMFLVFWGFLIFSKLLFRYSLNREVHVNRVILHCFCKKCGYMNLSGCQTCESCGESLSKGDGYFCCNCGYSKRLRLYMFNLEFWITFILLMALFFLPGIFYFFINFNKKICPDCKRMISEGDYKKKE